MKRLTLTLIILAVLTVASYSQEKKSKTGIIEIKTSAVCEMCKERIENYMSFERGVKSVDLNLETKILKIEYKTAKTTPEKLREAVTKIGYDADDMEADQEAYEKLPKCCRKYAPPH